MTQCAICLNEVRQTRNSKAIRCGHIFHSHCLEKWKNKGNVTCPICRKVFDGSNFRVQITVFNDYELTSNTVSVSNEFIFDALDILLASVIQAMQDGSVTPLLQRMGKMIK